VIDDEITMSGGGKAARAARRSKELVVGWFPHDFVEDYVPGRQTEVARLSLCLSLSLSISRLCSLMLVDRC
jgi:hypothetical protein